ncbi:hypothetical protein I6M49_21905 [Shewanella algae]|uniref:hypothetical protein n=2 Tax=Shewanella algae TaxID=38313 RepID=UPI001AAD9639|nr:hypothetical protein [Shewanella algae]MBO2656100.1 hypothetical protein [Shewanella algae]
MLKFVAGTLLLLAGGTATAAVQDVYHHKGLSVELEQSVSESEAEFKERAKRILMLKAISQTPKFVTLTTHFDSNRDELLEVGNVLQGAEVELNKFSITKSIDQVEAVVSGDLVVDVSAMRKKVESAHKHKSLQRCITHLQRTNRELVSILRTIQSNQVLSELSGSEVEDYLSMLDVKVKLDVVNGSEILSLANAVENGLTQEQIVQREVELAYRTFIYPFIEHANVDYKIAAVTPIGNGLLRLTINLKIDRNPEAISAWFPKSRAMMELCDKYFYHCDSLYEEGSKRGVAEYLEPRYCSNNLFAFLPYGPSNPPRFVSGQDAPACRLLMPHEVNQSDHSKAFYKGYLSGTLINTEMDKPYLMAFKTLSLDAYWLSFRLADEVVRLNLSDVTVENIEFFLYLPESVAGSDFDVSMAVSREVYRVKDASWRGLNGELLRHQPRGVIFY